MGGAWDGRVAGSGEWCTRGASEQVVFVRGADGKAGPAARGDEEEERMSCGECVIGRGAFERAVASNAPAH